MLDQRGQLLRAALGLRWQLMAAATALILTGCATGGILNASWVAPVTNTDGTPVTELSRSLLNLAERDGRASYPQFTAARGIPT